MDDYSPSTNAHGEFRFDATCWFSDIITVVFLPDDSGVAFEDSMKVDGLDPSTHDNCHQTQLRASPSPLLRSYTSNPILECD